MPPPGMIGAHGHGTTVTSRAGQSRRRGFNFKFSEFEVSLRLTVPDGRNLTPGVTSRPGVVTVTSSLSL